MERRNDYVTGLQWIKRERWASVRTNPVLNIGSTHARSKPQGRGFSTAGTLVMGLSFLLLCVYPTISAAQVDESTSTSIPFVDPTILDPSIPTPSSVIGHEVGEKAVRYDPLMRYLEELTASSDRIKMNLMVRPTKGERWLTCLLPARKTISAWIKSRPATENSLTRENWQMRQREEN